ncbi:4-carboxymuconolactone decarboxylase [Niveomyces insectorum RCEF 264]|uniref:4-carboxymuconolactone decarboxylase n=1 Tax=Niveomyces insectorum RCEF 264 TaxID=1081102 RepID=A0A167XTW4_9HYPO|nr:4-carboxymuconolactone decarboxylase [Niveomyces insectorum RCEF 264]
MSDQPNREAIVKAEELLHEEGTKIRAQVLGASHVSNSKALAEFQQPMQSIAVAMGWSLIWTRPNLEKRVRSLLVIVMLAVLGRNHELGVHVQGAIRNGATEQDIQEALIQASVYAGAPCALESTRIAYEALEKMRANGELK